MDQYHSELIDSKNLKNPPRIKGSVFPLTCTVYYQFWLMIYLLFPFEGGFHLLKWVSLSSESLSETLGFSFSSLVVTRFAVTRSPKCDWTKVGGSRSNLCKVCSWLWLLLFLLFPLSLILLCLFLKKSTMAARQQLRSWQRLQTCNWMCNRLNLWDGMQYIKHSTTV